MRIFISAVSSEFASYRRMLANTLGAQLSQQFEVLIQEDFDQRDPTLLKAIGEIIKQSDLVVHLVGTRCGYVPTDEHVRTALAGMGLPIPDPLPERSATQWEYYLARDLGKRVLVYVAEESAPREPGPKPEELGRTETSGAPREQAARNRAVHQTVRQPAGLCCRGLL